MEEKITLGHSLIDVDYERRRGTCSICGPDTVLYSNGRGKKNVRLRCSTPAREREKQKARRKTYDQQIIYKLRQYSMTEEDYDELWSSNDGRCHICNRETQDSRNFAIDHDHRCCPSGGSCGGCIRGLLCTNCNLGLGNFKDNPDFLNRALGYLLRSS